MNQPAEIDRYNLARDHVGYGETPPDFRWPYRGASPTGTEDDVTESSASPDGARVAISLVVNVEDGAERSRFRGDTDDDTRPDWATHPPHERGNPELESAFDYGSRAGIWRLLRIIDHYRLPLTSFACGRALQLNPAVAEALARRGVEIADHGLLWEPHAGLTPEELQLRMTSSAQIIRELTGTEPTSWYSRDGHSAASLMLVTQRGYSHDSNCFCDDMPFEPPGASGQVALPYAADTNDATLLTSISTGRRFESLLNDALDTLLTDDRPGARILSVGLHPRWIGRPSYAGSLLRFLDRATSTPSVVFAQRSQLAQWWRAIQADGAA